MSLFFQPIGWALGLLDFSFSLMNLVLGPRCPKFASSGWGDLATVYGLQDELLKSLEDRDSDAIPLSNNIEWGKVTGQSDVTIHEGKFLSPVADLLPEESKFCRFYLVSPAEQNTKSESDVYVIMLPATGEMGKSTRLNMATHLAKHFGWSSIIVTAPFYASRKPKEQILFFLDTVSKLSLQSLGIIHETAALGCHFLKQSPRSKVCITGFSWGASMSACASAAVLLGDGHGSRLACVPYVGSASPVVLADGLLETAIDWEALKEDENDTQSKVRQKLYHELCKTQLTMITDSIQQKGTNFIGVVRAGAMSNDHFIRRRYVNEFLEQLQTLGSKASEVSVQWLPGGHVFAMFLRPRFQRNAIIDAVTELTKKA